MTRTNKKINNERVVKVLIASVVLSTIYYVYLVNATTINAATAEKNQEKITDLQSEISELEFKFIEKNRQVKQEKSLEFDLTEVVNDNEISYVTLSQETRLTLNVQE